MSSQGRRTWPKGTTTVESACTSHFFSRPPRAGRARSCTRSAARACSRPRGGTRARRRWTSSLSTDTPGCPTPPKTCSTPRRGARVSERASEGAVRGRRGGRGGSGNEQISFKFQGGCYPKLHVVTIPGLTSSLPLPLPAMPVSTVYYTAGMGVVYNYRDITFFFNTTSITSTSSSTTFRQI